MFKIGNAAACSRDGDRTDDFEHEYSAAMQGDLAPGLNVRFVSLRISIAMKQHANQPRDLDDIQHLRWILEERKSDE